MEKILTSKWAQAVYALVLSALMAWQEVSLGGSLTGALMGMVTATAFGLMVETIRFAMKHGGWTIVNVLPWIGGGIVGAAIVAAFGV